MSVAAYVNDYTVKTSIRELTSGSSAFRCNGSTTMAVLNVLITK
jgi:hypothetical protein